LTAVAVRVKCSLLATAPAPVQRRLSRKRQDALIEAHLPLAKSIATAAFRRLPNHPFEDILGAARLGLVDAARRFLPAKKVPFEAYARTRISGSIIDAHRKLHKTQYVNEFPPEPVDDGLWFQKPLENHMLRKAMQPALKLLDPFELRIVQLRYGQDMTLSAIAGELDVSECHVSQVHKRVLGILRSRCEVLGLGTQQ
jgi:RNA polymerase sigma factor (sigma-70 family)